MIQVRYRTVDDKQIRMAKISYQEWHLTIRLDPDFVPSVRSNDIQRCNMQPEFSCFSKFAKTGSERKEIFSCDGSSEVGESELQVVYTSIVESKHIAFGRRRI